VLLIWFLLFCTCSVKTSSQDWVNFILRPVMVPTNDFNVELIPFLDMPFTLGLLILWLKDILGFKPCGCASKHFWYRNCEQNKTSTSTTIECTVWSSATYFTCSFDSFTERSSGWFTLEHMRNEQVLGGVHYESALFYIFTYSQKR